MQLFIQKPFILALAIAAAHPAMVEGRSLGPEKYANPVFNTLDCADPSVERGPDGRFHCFVTGGWGRVSDDMVNWRDSYGKMASMPTWNGYDGLWAPDVTRVGNKYIMYYAHSEWMGDLWDHCGVGVAVADKIEGPYIDHGKLFTSREIGVYNSIDPHLFVEDDGRLYLSWGSYWGGLFAIELSQDGLSIKPGAQKVQLTAPDFEGCMIHKHNGYYYLFASTGTCCEDLKSTYTTVVGRSTNYFGPYVDRAGGRMLDGKYHIVISNNRYFKGTGHNAEIITDDAGNDWIYYHAYEDKSPSTGRILMMDRVRWVDDWPLINNGFSAYYQVSAPYVHDAAADPAIEVKPANVSLEGVAGRSVSTTLNVTVRNLEGDVFAYVDGADATAFAVSPSRFSDSRDITLTCTPTSIGVTTATLVLESQGAPTVRVPLSVNAADPDISYSDNLGTLENVWIYSQNRNNLSQAPWFAVESPYTRSMTVIGDKLYVLNASAYNNAPSLNVINADTGDKVGSLSLEGLPVSGQLMCGGALGHLGNQLIMSNAVSGTAHRFIVYKWENNSGAPVRILDIENTLGIAYGEIMGTWGDMNKGRIAFGNLSNVVYFDVEGGVVNATPHVITLEDGPLTESKNSPRGKFEVRFMDDGTFWHTSYWTTPTRYGIDGSVARVIERVPAKSLTSTTGTVFVPFAYGERKYAATVSTDSDYSGGHLEIIDITDGVATANSQGIYPAEHLGDANWTKGAACTDVEYAPAGNRNSMAKFWVMVPQQGIAHFRYNGETLNGVDKITSTEDENQPEQWYNLQGVPVKADNLVPGIYIRRKASRVSKVVVK